MSTPRSNPTLQDVAELAGVSTATVSRALNAPDQVIEPTRQKVMGAVETLGYTPNFGARAMASQRTRTIGAIIPTMENAVFARGIQAFQEELATAGYTLLVASSSYRPDLEEQQIRSLVARGADALLLIGHARHAQIFDFLDSRAIPTLITWAHDPEHARPSVGFDNRRAMHALTAEVIARGHRRIAVITVDAKSNDRVAAREAGIRDALREAGQSQHDLLLDRTRYSIENGAASFARIIDHTPRPTAVICVNDVLAVGAVGKARDMGLSVPNDISIVGFDDIELAQVAHPGLTTVHVPHAQMGRVAARTLIAHLDDGTPLHGTELVTEICHRQSLGPPPAS